MMLATASADAAAGQAGLLLLWMIVSALYGFGSAAVAVIGIAVAGRVRQRPGARRLGVTLAAIVLVTNGLATLVSAAAAASSDGPMADFSWALGATGLATLLGAGWLARMKTPAAIAAPSS